MRMREHEARDDRSLQFSPEGPDDNNLKNLGQASERMLAAAAEIIRRVQSGDSEKFLEANRQQGGE